MDDLNLGPLVDGYKKKKRKHNLFSQIWDFFSYIKLPKQHTTHTCHICKNTIFYYNKKSSKSVRVSFAHSRYITSYPRVKEVDPNVD